MTATQIDPRVIAESLFITTDDLARVLTKWAAEELPKPDYDRAWEPMALEDFDYAVARARNYLVAAHEAQRAYNEDNPEEPEVE
jgi:hypothetical protein